MALQQFQATSIAVTFKPGVTMPGAASTGAPSLPSSPAPSAPAEELCISSPICKASSGAAGMPASCLKAWVRDRRLSSQPQCLCHAV